MLSFCFKIVLWYTCAIKDQNKLICWWGGYACLILHKGSNLGWIFDPIECRVSRFSEKINILIL